MLESIGVKSFNGVDHGDFITGAGSPPQKQAYRTGSIMVDCSLSHDLVAAATFNYHPSEVQKVKANLGRLGGMPFYFPVRSFPGCPNGFNGNPDTALNFMSTIEGDINFHLEDVQRQSAIHGSSLGYIWQWATPGGHIRINEPLTTKLKEIFPIPREQHVGVFALPTNDLHARDNLIKFADFPYELDIPFFLADNKFEIQLDKAFQWMMVMSSDSRHFTCQTQKARIENLAEMGRKTETLGFAFAYEDVPYVPIPVYEKGLRHLRGLTVNVLPKQEMNIRVSRLLAKVFWKDAKLIDCPEPDPELRQLVMIGGVEHPQNRGLTEQELKDYTSPIIERAKTQLKNKKIEYPSGTKVIWSSIHESIGHNMGRIYAVRIFQIPNYTVRDFIDAMLKGQKIS